MDCMGNAASSGVASSGCGGSENVRVSTSSTRATWTETPSGAIVQNSDSGTASAFGVSRPMRARYPRPSGCQHENMVADASLSAARKLLLVLAESILDRHVAHFHF